MKRNENSTSSPPKLDDDDNHHHRRKLDGNENDTLRMRNTYAETLTCTIGHSDGLSMLHTCLLLGLLFMGCISDSE